MGNENGKPKMDPKEEFRQNKRLIDRSARKIEREIGKL